MKLNCLSGSKCRSYTIITLVVVVVSIFLLEMGCAKNTAKSVGSIVSIDLSNDRFQPGETLTVYVKVQNDGEARAHFLVALEVQYGDKTVYDSHRGKKSHNHKGDECLDAWVNTGAEQTIGPFVWKIPNNASSGTYHVGAGLRVYPWEPLLMFRGARWCPPETTFEVRK